MTPKLNRVRDLIRKCLADTSLGNLLTQYDGVIAGGKMLRARLILRVGPAAHVAESALLPFAAAIELIHAASLLHDDVIDGGTIRRGAPAFWVERGIQGAILTGDLLLFKAFELLSNVENARVLPLAIKLTGETCEAETEQELIFRGRQLDWSGCVSVARRKTGSLFALSAALAGGGDETLCGALKEAGYAIGTAYQLADDFLDANGCSDLADKSLGSDRARGKTTTAHVAPPPETSLPTFLNSLLDESCSMVARWPEVAEAWAEHLRSDIRPAIDQLLSASTHASASN